MQHRRGDRFPGISHDEVLKRSEVAMPLVYSVPQGLEVVIKSLNWSSTVCILAEIEITFSEIEFPFSEIEFTISEFGLEKV